jgi:hypothetical protein
MVLLVNGLDDKLMNSKSARRESKRFATICAAAQRFFAAEFLL